MTKAEKLFPSLIGRLKTLILVISTSSFMLFPSLIGRLKTRYILHRHRLRDEFPSLIGRLKTYWFSVPFIFTKLVSIPYRKTKNVKAGACQIQCSRFPSLIGRLKTPDYNHHGCDLELFPSLIGRLKTDIVSFFDTRLVVVSIPYRKTKNHFSACFHGL